MIQGSDEWFAARCGKATASEFGSILAKGKGDTRDRYLHRVLTERMTGKPSEQFHSKHLDRGHQQEPLARMAYEAHTLNLVDLAGFIDHPTLKAGCSPDGLVGDEGGVEIKSVLPAVQTQTILSGGYPPEHHAQVQGNLWITRRRWWDFVSYSPELPPHLQLYVYRVLPDAAFIERLSIEVSRFLREIDDLYQTLMEKTYDHTDC